MLWFMGRPPFNALRMRKSAFSKSPFWGAVFSFQLGSCVAAALLSSCGGPQTPIGATGAPVQRPASDAPSKQLVYVASEQGCNHIAACQGVVSVLTYPQGKDVGQWIGGDSTITEGVCADKGGNVFVLLLGYSDAEILVFAHGSSSPMTTLSIRNGGVPDSCSSDPTTGNLAVLVRFQTGQGVLLVYSHASGTPKQYTDSHLRLVDVAYDDKGNIFADSTTDLAELPRGKNSFKVIKLNRHGHHLGTVQWDGTYMTNQYTTYKAKVPFKIYRYAINGNRGKEVGITSLWPPRLPPSYFCCHGAWIQGDIVLGTYLDGVACDYVCSGGVEIWHYPAGARPFRSIGVGLGNPMQ